jgi:hypothetical protein
MIVTWLGHLILNVGTLLRLPAPRVNSVLSITCRDKVARSTTRSACQIAMVTTSTKELYRQGYHPGFGQLDSSFRFPPTNETIEQWSAFKVQKQRARAADATSHQRN